MRVIELDPKATRAAVVLDIAHLQEEPADPQEEASSLPEVPQLELQQVGGVMPRRYRVWAGRLQRRQPRGEVA